MDKQLNELDQRVARLQRELQRAKNQKKERQRTIDTRRKILLGALLLRLLEDNEFGNDFKDIIKGKLDSYLTKDIDRALFADLLPDESDNQNRQENDTKQNSASSSKANRSEDMALTKQTISPAIANDKGSKKSTSGKQTRRLKSAGKQQDILEEFNI